MKVIFLDIDGVMNSEDWYKEHLGEGDIDDRAVKLLNLYIKKHDIHIVITSSWRELTLKQTLQVLGETAMVDIIDHIIGQTPRRFDRNRGKEIDTFLKDRPEIDEFYIIDDEDFDIHQKERLIQTDYKHGLTQEDLDKMTWI